MNAEARLAGDALWGFQTFDSDANSKKSSGVTFKHQYSLLYSNGGQLQQGNLGRYQYDIGYEWAQFNTKISTPGSDQSITESSGHFLYSGQIDLKPNRFPIRLKAYSRDLSRTGFNDSAPFLGDDMLASGITDSLMSGTHIRNGALLVVGLTKDEGVPIFRDYPKLTLDYRQNYDHDSKDIAPIHTQSDFLTMTLTKGDVGFYHSRTEFKDYLNKSKTVTSEYTVGTLGDRGSRKWVDLTNWIRLSADASFIEGKDSVVGESTNEYDVNMFAVAARNKWDMVTLNNFHRTSSPSAGITQSLNIPVYLKGVWDAETDWQLRLSANDRSTRTTTAGASVGSTMNSDLLATLQVNALKRSKFTVSPYVSVERLQTELENTSIFTANVETASTRRFSERYAFSAKYDVSLITTDTTDSTHHEFVRNNLSGRAVYRMSDTLRFELEESLTAGSGTTTQQNAYLNDANSGNASQTGSSIAFQRQEVTTGYYQSITKLTASWVPMPRLRVGLALTGNVLQPENADNDILTTAAATVQYDLPSFRVGSTVRLTKRTVGSFDATEITGSGQVQYAPDPKLSTDLIGNYSIQESSGSRTESTVEMIQRFRYSFSKNVGYNVRKLLDIREELSYIHLGSSPLSSLAVINSSQKRLLVGADYYLTKNWVAYAAIRYSLLEPGSEKELVGTSGLNMTYRKLQANIEYGYGKRNGKDDNRVEKRFAANLRKQF